MKRIAKISFLRLLLSATTSRNPELRIALGYLLYVAAGTLALCLPFAVRTDIGFIDHLFNATSALSTTGLATRAVADYTIFGQMVLLGLIQIGGLGFMTLSSYIMLASFHHINPTGRSVIDTALARPSDISLRELVKVTIRFTLITEIAGFLLLLPCFICEGTPNAVWNALFHSISSFCTAGLSPFPDSMEGFRFNTGINLIISALSYLGAIGFIVVVDLWKKVTARGYKITFTSRIILTATLAMAVLGTAAIFFAEPSIREFAVGDRLLVSFFQAMSAMTTVGYNSVPLGAFSSGALMVLILLMVIGASPSGTGGGLKSTTVTAIAGLVSSKLSHREKVTIFGNAIPSYRADAAIAAFTIYTALLFLGLMLLCFIEPHSLTELFFEASSALGTVGLSMGITGELTVAGKIILILLMFIGRCGVVTFGAIFLRRASLKHIRESDLAI